MAAGVVHGTAWWLLTSRLLEGREAFTAVAERDGWQIETGPATRTGWPWAAAIRLPHVVARRDLGGMALEWHADSVDVRLTPNDPRAVRIGVFGDQAIKLGTGAPLPVRTAATWLRVPLTIGETTFELRDLRVGAVQAGLVNGQVAPLAFGLTAAPVVLSPGLDPPFDKGFAVTMGLAVTMPLPNAASPKAAAAAWQSQGGRLSVPRLELTWGPVHLTGSGTGGLDEQLQATGRATLQVQGGPEILDAAARAGLVAPGPASAIRAVLGLLVLASPGGVVTLPVTLEKRTLTAAQFPLARLPTIDW